ncbi:Hsp20 family protein [Staphylococcus pseudoxylosus]|uniref:Hsp20 family protein n=1 Tax=Staphylococcus pseudoxylosus TaxID=2282419 RepID=UPI003F5623F5
MTNKPFNLETFNHYFKNFQEKLATEIFNVSIDSDIKEEYDQYILISKIPNSTKNLLNLKFFNNILILRGEKYDHLVKRKSLYLNNVDVRNIYAEYNNGILEVRLPKLTPGKNVVQNIDVH